MKGAIMGALEDLVEKQMDVVRNLQQNVLKLQEIIWKLMDRVEELEKEHVGK